MTNSDPKHEPSPMQDTTSECLIITSITILDLFVPRHNVFSCQKNPPAKFEEII